MVTEEGDKDGIFGKQLEPKYGKWQGAGLSALS
jgi:hypothetical protein